MSEQLHFSLEALFRWIHVVAGVLWIGLLYFFNWVNGPFAKTLDGDSKKKVVPELLPRALFWFRWGAAYTWVSGVLLLGLVYYMGGLMGDGNPGSVMMRTWGVLIVGVIVYDVMWKTAFAKNETAAVAVTYVLLLGLIFYMNTFMPARALYIHVAAMFGTAMAMNVWMRIWPAQRQIITAIKGGQAPDAALVGLAGLRSKHNTYMSVPLLFMMVSNHYPTVVAMQSGGGAEIGWIVLAALIAGGWAVTKMIYGKAAQVPGF